MHPKAWGDGGFILSFVCYVLAYEVVGKFTGLGQSIYTFVDVKVYPNIPCIGSEVVFRYKLLGDVLEANVGILGTIKGCA